MKATELMIGNLVRCRESSCQGHRVDFVNEMNGEVGVDGEILNLDMVYPIPLTPEILEKNGWEYNNLYDEEYYVNEDGFDIHINGEKFEIRCIDAVNIQLKYLHELQHALKLCGIEKEIEL